jgi:hypothetical protein
MFRWQQNYFWTAAYLGRGRRIFGGTAAAIIGAASSMWELFKVKISVVAIKKRFTVLRTSLRIGQFAGVLRVRLEDVP